MNIKSVVPAVLILILITPTLGTTPLSVYANEVPSLYFTLDGFPARLRIVSPIDNNSYGGSSILLNVDLVLNGAVSYQEIGCSYSLDNGEWKSISLNSTTSNDWQLFPNGVIYYSRQYWYKTVLPELHEGSHFINVTVYDDAQGHIPSELTPLDTSFFTVDRTPPSISILSLENNNVYWTTELSLDFVVNEQTSWTAYSLDGQANIVTDGNTTLTELTNGFHGLVVYTGDMAGNEGHSETISFTIIAFSITWLLIIIAAISIVSAGLFIWLKKSKYQAKKVRV